MRKVLFVLGLLIPFFAGARELCSPDGRISVKIETGKAVTYSVAVDGNICLAPSEIALKLEDGTVLGGAAKLLGTKTVACDETIDAKIYHKSKVLNKYNEMTLRFKGFNLVFRAYDNGVAYRFVTNFKKPFNVLEEKAEFAFPKDFKAFVPYVRKEKIESLKQQFHNSFENRYSYINLSEFDAKRIAFLPLMVECDGGVKLVITESDLLHYPGMFLSNTDASNVLRGVFAPYPKLRTPEKKKRVISMFVEETEAYIAKSAGVSEFPWRAVGISRNDAELLANDLVYCLASPQSKELDFNWVKPGKVAWDWWNDWNIRGVDFKAGINTQTYKYYIDFASAKGIEYIILDEGWSDVTKANLYTVIPEIDMEELIRYAASKNVGLILWAGFYPFQKDVEGLCKYWSEKGAKGFKIDFFDSDDQQIPELLERIARSAAENHMLLDFHGIFKPTGLCRKYPNVLNYEGIYGQETTKWAANEKQVAYEVELPFIRFFAGSADYTPGAMRNFTKKSIVSDYTEPGSVGTRCRQLAESIIYCAPLNMLCDSPSNYYKEEECTDFLASIPTVWDEVKPLYGETGKYVALARRNGKEWFVAGMNDWNVKDMELAFDFLPEGQFEYVLFKDGVNADRIATDYKRESGKLDSKSKMTVHLAPAGGFAIRISEKK